MTLHDRIASHDEGDTPVVKFLSIEDNGKEPLNIFVNSTSSTKQGISLLLIIISIAALRSTGFLLQPSTL